MGLEQNTDERGVCWRPRRRANDTHGNCAEVPPVTAAARNRTRDADRSSRPARFSGHVIEFIRPPFGNTPGLFIRRALSISSAETEEEMRGIASSVYVAVWETSSRRFSFKLSKKTLNTDAKPSATEPQSPPYSSYIFWSRFDSEAFSLT